MPSILPSPSGVDALPFTVVIFRPIQEHRFNLRVNCLSINTVIAGGDSSLAVNYTARNAMLGSKILGIVTQQRPTLM